MKQGVAAACCTTATLSLLLKPPHSGQKTSNSSVQHFKYDRLIETIAGGPNLDMLLAKFIDLMSLLL